MYQVRFFLIAVAALHFSSCSQKTKKDSDEYNTPIERVEALKLELNEHSDFTDAEFELFNVNGFHDARGLTVPGASSWDYKFAVKVDTADVLKWVEGMQKVDSMPWPQQWRSDIVKRDPGKWTGTSIPTFYESSENGGDVEAILFHREGIVFKRITQN